MSNKILVTGATGNIGSEVVKALQAKGADFIAATSGESIEGVKSVSLNFGDVASLEKAMQGIDTLFMVIPGHPEMVQWGKNIVEAAKKSGIKHIVRSSGSLAKIESSLKIVKLLKETDQDVIDSGIDNTITAPQFFMQNFINNFAADYKNGTIYQPAGDGKMGFVDVRDIGAVNAEVLINPKKYKNQTLTITGCENLSYADAVAQMNEVLGKDAKYVAVPDEAAIGAMKEMQFPEFIIDLLISLNHTVVEGFAEEINDTVEKVTGNKPILFKQFVADHKQAWL